MGNDLEILVDSLVNSYVERRKKKKYGEEGYKLEWLLKENFPKTPPTIRKMEINEEGDMLTYHINVPIPLSFEDIKKIESKIAFTIKHDCEVSMADNYEVFVRFFDNRTPAYCEFKEEYLELLPQRKGLPILLGQDRKGLIIEDFSELAHYLVSGTSGSGKSNLLRLILTSILLNPNSNVDLYLADFKKVEFCLLMDYGLKVAYDQQTLNTMLKKIKKEAERRTDILLEKRKNNINKLNIKLPHIVIIIDEFSELAQKDKKDDIALQNQIMIDEIARLGRSSAISLIMCTQKPEAKVYPLFSQTREQLSGRISFRMNDESSSRMVIGNISATKIKKKQKGRGIVADGGGEQREIQFLYLDHDRMDELIERKLGGLKIEKNDSNDYIDIECKVIDENCISITGVNEELINKVNKEKDIANLKYRKDDNNGQRKNGTESVRNDTRREKDNVLERKEIRNKITEEGRSRKGQSNNGDGSGVQNTNSSTNRTTYLF